MAIEEEDLSWMNNFKYENNYNFIKNSFYCKYFNIFDSKTVQAEFGNLENLLDLNIVFYPESKLIIRFV